MNDQIPTESAEQKLLFEWAAYQGGRYPALSLLFHIPNGGARRKSEAARMSAEGVRAGVPNATWYEIKADGRILLVCLVCWEDHLEAARREGVYLADAVRQRGKGVRR